MDEPRKTNQFGGQPFDRKNDELLLAQHVLFKASSSCVPASTTQKFVKRDDVVAETDNRTNNIH